MCLGRRDLNKTIRLIVLVAVIVIAMLQEQAVELVIGNGGGGQSTLPANQGDQRGAGHSMMQGGGGGSNLSCQLLQAASRATPTQVTRPRQQACSQAVGDVAKGERGLLVISTLSIAMTTVIACVHSGYITVTMTATATAIVQTTLTLTTTMTTVASSSASRCNSSTAAQPLKLPALPPRPCVLQLDHSCQNHSTSQQPAQCSQPGTPDS